MDLITKEFYMGAGLDPASRAIFAAFTTPPTVARQIAINNYVVALKNAGIWPLLDLLFVFAAADAQSSLVNWVNPSHSATVTAAPTFSANHGYTGNGTTSCVDSGFDPTTAPSPNFTQNSCCQFGRELVVGSGALFGGSADVIFDPDFPLWRMNCATGLGPAGMNLAALWSMDRGGATSAVLYENGVSFSTNSESSAAQLGSNLFALRAGSTLFGTHQTSCMGAGAHLNATQQAALSTADFNYMHAIGTL